MSASALSSEAARNRLAAKARDIIATHTLDGGVCRICQVPDCLPLQGAVALLAKISDA